MARRKKKTGGIIRFAVIVSLVIAAFLFGIPAFKNIVAEKTVDAGISKMSEEISGLTGIPPETIRAFIDAVPSEDRKTVVHIVANHLDSKTISDVSGLAKKQDGTGLLQYAENTLTDSEKGQVGQLIDKYTDPSHADENRQIAESAASSLSEEQKEQIGQLIRQYTGIVQ